MIQAFGWLSQWTGDRTLVLSEVFAGGGAQRAVLVSPG